MKQRQSERRRRALDAEGRLRAMELSRRSLVERFNAWRLGISIEAESVLKAVLLAALTLLYALLQTTLLARFRPFGAIPDLLLPFVLTVGTLERERWGASLALASAFFIEAIGSGVTLTLLPLVYVPCAVAAGLLTTYYFRDSLPVTACYVTGAALLRGAASLVTSLVCVADITPRAALLYTVLPELASTLLCAALPCLLTRALLRPFHKTRAERTGGR